MSDGSLPSPAEMFSRASRMYRERWRLILLLVVLGKAVVVAVVLLTVALVLLTIFLASVWGWRGWEALVLFGVSGMTLAMAFSAWAQVALLMSLADEVRCPGLAGCLHEAWSRLPGFLWMLLLWMLACMGSFAFLVVPGLVLTLWLAFAPLIFLTEKIGPMDALLKSCHYVRGRSWPVAGRLCLASAAVAGPGAVPLAGPLLRLLAWPFAMANLAVLLGDLRRARAAAPFQPSRRDRALLLVAMAGCLLQLMALPLVWSRVAPRLLERGRGLAVVAPLMKSLQYARGRP